MTDLGGDKHAEPPIRTVREREVYRNQFIALYDDDVVMPDNSSGRYLRVVQSDGRPGVAMLAHYAGLFALVKVYRYATGEWEWGIPRGFAHGDDPLESARLELCQELGGPPVDIIPMGEATPNTGLLADRVKFFYARYGEPIADPIDVVEVAEVRWVDFQTLLDEIAAGKVIEGFTMSAITLALARGMLKLPNGRGALGPLILSSASSVRPITRANSAVLRLSAQ